MFLTRWYQLNSNAVPPVYMIKPINQCLPDYLSTNQEMKQVAIERWKSESEALMEAIHKAAIISIGETKANKYLALGMYIIYTLRKFNAQLFFTNASQETFWLNLA